MTGKRSYISGEVFTGLRTNARMTFASICAIAICLVLVGLIAILGDIFFRAVDQQAASAEYFVYIEENATDAERMALQENIQLTPNVKEVEFISKETAKKDFAAFLETDALDGLPADIFRDRFVITMSDGSKAKETISIIEGYHCIRAGQAERCGETISRAPQSWCYTVAGKETVGVGLNNIAEKGERNDLHPGLR